MSALACPRCAAPGEAGERFCAACGMPLVFADAEAAAEPDPDGLSARARKVKPQLAEGGLVRVAGGRNQAEAELIQGMLLEEGVPSVLRRSAGWDVPHLLAAGPRDVLVPASGAAVAREALLQADAPVSAEDVVVGPRPGRLLAGLLVAVALVAVIAWLGTEVLA